MTTKLEIPIPNLGKPPRLKFPEACLNCGKPPQERIGMSFPSGGKKDTLQLSLPYCKTCADRERQMFLFGLGPFALGFCIAGLLVFIPVWLVTPTGDTPQTMAFNVVVAAFAGLLAGLVGGALTELLSKPLFALFLGSSFARRPLFALELLSDVSYSLGITGQFDRKHKKLSLTFERDDIAQEFMQSLKEGA